jgi:hypothetical protein
VNVGDRYLERPFSERAASKEAVANAVVVAWRASEITPERVAWLWPGRIARGKHTCIAGEPGVGKSQLLIDIIAKITTGGDWPCAEGKAPVGNVILLSAEDGPADTIVPRLIAAGADLTRVHIVTATRSAGVHRGFNLQADLGALEAKVAEVGNVGLVGVDPISSYLGRTDSHKNSEVRGVLEPLTEMAERNRVAIASVTHFSKGGATKRALHKFMGSIAFVGGPRVAFAVVEDAQHDGRRLLLSVKNNLTQAPRGLSYHLAESTVADGIVVSHVAWCTEHVDISVDAALAATRTAGKPQTLTADAAEFLKALLADGRRPAEEVKRLAAEKSYSAKVVREAREELGIVCNREGFGAGSVVWWSLP